LLPEPPNAPFDGDLRGALALEPGQPERLDHVAPHQLLLAEAGELEHVPPAREDARVAVADDEARAGRRVVVLEQLEQEPEPAALARDRLLAQALAPVVVDRALLAVGADEVRHEVMVGTGPQRFLRK